MIHTYEKYLKHPTGNSLKIEDALQIYEEMAASFEKCRLEDKMDFWNECLKKAAEYTKIRNDWEFMSREEKADDDGRRSLVHNSFITSINVLSRIAGNEGIDNTWREKLGDDRKKIGDFACFISYMTGVSNR